MTKKYTLFLLTALMILLLAGCSNKPPKPEPGRCFNNGDCPKGQRCNDTRCEDIYFPRKDIKPY